VNALKRAGAKKIYLLSASPMIKWPCYLGIDTPDKEQLIAANNSLEQIKKKIKCDYLGFLSLSGLIKCVNGKDEFCTGCFDRKYPVKR
jgi:amidophosphoribosyltransferase